MEPIAALVRLMGMDPEFGLFGPDAFGPDLRFQTVSVARDGAQSGSPATATDGPWATPAAAADAWATPTPMYGDDTPF